jgi:hypothetical protein
MRKLALAWLRVARTARGGQSFLGLPRRAQPQLPTYPSLTMAFILVLAAVAGLPRAARADTLTVKCEEQGAGAPAEMTLAYEGEQSGTLKVKAAYGEMALPATKEPRCT